MRLFLRLLVHIDPYSFLEEVAGHFASGRREHATVRARRLCWPLLDDTADEKLTSFALRLVLTDHVGIPRENRTRLADRSRGHLRPEEAQGGKAKKAQQGQRSPPSSKPSREKDDREQQKAA